jgi:hypothetical protein
VERGATSRGPTGPAGYPRQVLPARASAAVLWCAALLLTGCGGSVADADEPRPARTERVAPSPFCAAARASSDAVRPLDAVVAGRGGGAALGPVVEAVRRTNATLVETAPADVRADVETIVRVVSRQLDALVAGGGDASALRTDPELAALASAPATAAAQSRYADYVRTTCRIGDASEG